MSSQKRYMLIVFTICVPRMIHRCLQTLSRYMPSCNKTCNGNGEHPSSKYKLWFTAANNTFQKTDLLATKELITRFPVLYRWLRGTTSQPIGEEIFFSVYHGIADWSTGLWDLLFKHLQLSISKLERQGWDCLDLSGGIVDIYWTRDAD